MSENFIGTLILLSLLLCGCSPTHSKQEKPYAINEISDQNSNHTDQATREKEFSVDIIPQNEDIQFERNAAVNTLPFPDFIDRWNAITDELMSNLHITSLENMEQAKETYYLSQLTNLIQLKVFVKDNQIYQLEMTSEGQSSSSVITMLTGWNQIVTIMNPLVEGNEVDAFFHEMGIGSNSDLSQLKLGSHTYQGTHYLVARTNNGYTFTASYVPLHNPSLEGTE